MSIDYILECGDRLELPGHDDVFTAPESSASDLAWCDTCRTWRTIIERADPADEVLHPVRLIS